MDLLEKLKDVPHLPGVYMMYDERDEIIYVGKAKNLSNRLKQYFYKANRTVKVMAMMENVRRFSYIITKSEIDALLTENNLIKFHQPKYNILLKDDKAYPFLRIDLKESFPKLTLVRSLKPDGAKYFGPYMLSVNISDVTDLIHSAFKIRSCRQNIGEKKLKPCLNYYLNKCLAPCTGEVTEEEYRAEIDKVISFLKGNDDVVERILKEKMLNFSKEENFEAALSCREKLKVLGKLVRKQITNMPFDKNIDVFSLVSDGTKTAVSLLIVRGGKMVGVDNFISETSDEDLSSFVMQFYEKNLPVVDEILFDENSVENVEALEGVVSSLAGRKVLALVPIKGIRKQLVEVASTNAMDYLTKYGERDKRIYDMTKGAVCKLMTAFNLPKIPRRIEAFDISHLSGTNKVSSMVVFIDGKPKHALYRRFKIKTVEGIDDFRSMKETLLRRLNRLSGEDESFSEMPDLILVDGGKGQLSFAKEALSEMGQDIPILSLAEREEEIYMDKEPIVLNKNSKELQLLQRVRDEAHRFAITFNRNLRLKEAMDSELYEIPTLGKARVNALLKHFKSISKIKEAEIVELEKVIPNSSAVEVYNYFRKKSTF